MPHRRGHRLARRTVAAGVAVVLGGCAAWRDAASDAEQASSAAGRDARERTLQAQWIGRTRGELVQSFGSPQQVFDVPGGRLPPALIFVYRGRDPASGCIDAFVVLRDGDQRVWNYFCR